jgi:predicted dehydrogenase
MKRALVVGLGQMGGFHHNVLQNHLGYTVDTVDIRPEAGARYASVREARLRTRYDVAVAAVPADQLYDSAYDLVGIPHVYVEKPFASTMEHAAMLGAFLSEHGKVCVGYLERFNPAVQELRRKLHESCVWEVRAMRFVRWSHRPSPNVTTDLLTHDIDLAHYLMGSNRDLWENSAALGNRCTFDTRANAKECVRSIEVDVRVEDEYAGCELELTWGANLLAHRASPLTILWHNFLLGNQVPTPLDAVRALRGALTVEQQGVAG